MNVRHLTLIIFYRYWVQSKCQDSTSSGEEGTEELQIENVAGIFIILLAGLILAIVVAGVERLFRKYRGKFCDKMQENKVSGSSFTPSYPCALL